ncbi:MAG: F0F1 ATP synthase subunit B [Calditrichaeota bacterium]|nr:F0F1 ATP synthase subunit B [Calditrichota bacterium]
MLLNVNTGLIFWTVVTFLLLLLTLKKLAWSPILGALQEREKRIQEDLERAEKAREESERLLEEQRQMLQKARQEAQEIIERGRKAAEAARQELLAKSKEEAEQLLEKARREIELSRDKALEEIRNLAVELSLAAAQKVIRKELDPDEHRRLVEEALQEMRGLS